MGRLSKNPYPCTLQKRSKRAKLLKQKYLERKIQQIESTRLAVTHDHGFYEDILSKPRKPLNTLHRNSKIKIVTSSSLSEKNTPNIRKSRITNWSNNSEDVYNGSPQLIDNEINIERDDFDYNNVVDNSETLETRRKNGKKSSETVIDLKYSNNKLQVNTNQKATKQKKIEVCILCAANSISEAANKSILHFAEMIKGFSGVNILELHAPPIACSCCFKLLERIYIFGKQITYTKKLISTTNIFVKYEENNEMSSSQKINFNADKSEVEIIEIENTVHKQRELPVINQKQKRTKAKCKNKGKVICTKCGTYFKNIDLLQYHQKFNKAMCRWKKSHNVNVEKSNKVILIPEKNVLNSNESHNSNDDDSEDYLFSFACTVCGKPYTYKNVKYCNCKETVEKKEVEKKTFVCSLCGKQYPCLRFLQRHEVTHGVKKHLCNICGEAFHFLLYLKRHMRKHTGEKPFPCEHCDKSFGTQWNLSQHTRLHTNSLPYKCRLCPAAYRHNVTLKKHVVTSHTASECADSIAKDVPLSGKEKKNEKE